MAEPNGAMQELFATVRALEKERESRIWCIIHRNRGHICAPAMWSVYAQRNNIGKGKRIELLLHSGGGHPELAYTIIKFFRRRFQEVNVIVPIYAKSAATLMCLGADHIYMGELADLGPIDIQIDDKYEHGAKSFSPLDEFRSMEFLRELSIEWMDYYASLMGFQYGVSIKQGLKDSVPLVTGLLRPVFGQIDPIKMGGFRRAIAIGEEYAKRILPLAGNRYSDEVAQKIIRKIVWEYPSHDFSIDLEEAQSLNLPVERLSESHDNRLCEAIFAIDEGDYHGFVPPEKTRTVSPKRPVRSTRAAAHGAAGEPARVNGGGGART